jgi:uncharacterized membrane protein
VNTLIAVAYDDLQTANDVVGTLHDLSKEKAIVLDDLVVVERQDDGKVKLHQTNRHIGKDAGAGALWGGLIGLLFLAPAVGAAIGAAAGGGVSAWGDLGVDDDFMRKLGENLKPGGAAVVALVADSTPEKVRPRISRYGGELIHTSLSDEAENELRAALAAAPPSA